MHTRRSIVRFRRNLREDRKAVMDDDQSLITYRKSLRVAAGGGAYFRRERAQGQNNYSQHNTMNELYEPNKVIFSNTSVEEYVS